MSVKIEISKRVKKVLDKIRNLRKETYNEVILRLIEDELELNKKTKRELEKARKSKSVPHHEARKRFGL